MKKQILFMLILVCSIVRSQEFPTIIPPSPEARKMIEYGNVPVAYSTGVPQIGVPLFNLPLGDLEIPISMSYHGSGVRVGDDSGTTGMKWSLTNGGGRISRTTMGRPDEDNYYQNSGWFYSAGNVDFENLTLADKENIEHGCYDLQPDEFNISLPNGFSGKFIFDENAKILMIPQTEDVKIEYTIYLNTFSWTITDLAGIQYIFETSETASVGNGCSAWDPQCRTFATFPSSWMLDRIIFPSGETVSYTYKNETYFEEKWTSQTYRKRKDQSIGQTQNCINVTTYANKLLTKIEFNDYLVEYSYSLKDPTNDMGGSKLDNLIIKNGATQIKKYKFSYDLSNRMFLMNIKEVSNVNKEQLYRAFDYYDKDKLPGKNSFAIDHFGFRNGNSNSMVVPKDDDYIETKIVSGANRLLDKNLVKVGTLKNIYYPTKGWTNFEYEPNIAYYNVKKKDEVSFGFSYAPQNEPLGWQTYYSNYFEVKKIPSNMDPSNGGTIKIKNLFVTLFNEKNDPGLNWKRPSLDLLDESGNVLYNRTLYHEGENVNSGTLGFNVASGKYRFKVNVYSSSPTISSPYVYSVRIKGTSTQERFINDQYYGGIRIKKITNFEKENVVASQREFFYEKFDDTTRSSGKRHYSLSTNYNFNVANNDTQTGCSLINSNVTNDYDIVISSNPIFSEYALGSAVRYKNVREVFVGDNEEYEIKRYFRDYGVAIEARYLGKIGAERALLKPKSFENYALGILVKEERFDKDKNLVQKIEHTYETLSPRSLGVDAAVAKATQKAYVGGGILDGVLCEHKVNYTEYPIFTRWFVKKSTVDTTFFDNNRFITQSTENFFDNPDHKQLTKREVINSDHKKIITYTKYPQDIINHTAAEQKLIDQHRIATPIEIKTSVQESGSTVERQTSKINNKYEVWRNEIIAPKKVSVTKRGNIIDNRIEYFDYDDKGNPLEISRADGVHSIYIWGYDQQYPIAKIENASYSQVSSYVSDLKTKSNADTDRTHGYLGKEGVLRQALDNLRTNLPNAMVTTYTYDPLIGVTSMTDPRGYTMYYKYDTQNRLKAVKDAEGHLLTENQYHYKNQN